jgi:hypothetical protein
MRQDQANLIGFDPCLWVSGVNLVKCMQEVPTEIPKSGEPLPELFVHGDPGDLLWLSRIDSVQSLSQPGVNIERHR